MPDAFAEKIQPCLLDRLTDDAPESLKESRSARTISIQRYREGVLRDLSWLLNARARMKEEGLKEFPEAAHSVLDFGIRDLCGEVASSLDIRELEHDLAAAIREFEPRILPRTLTVTAVAVPGATANVLAFEIRGELWATPMPEQLYIRTEIDLDTAQCALK
jgi:type VI secretion system protein ImpF